MQQIIRGEISLPNFLATSGTIYIVATPIGNLADISQRALDTLKQVNQIAAEDTRHSKKLLAHYGINTPLLALHEHNERSCIDDILNRVQQGENFALISDAGTPLISDPGYRLVAKAQQLAIRVVPIPGCCAAIVALSAAGLPSDRFVFEGYLPTKTQARLSHLESLQHETGTLIFYEAPHRIVDSIEAMSQAFGSDRLAVIARELTKTFETIHQATLGELIGWLEQDKNQQKGEFVVLVHGATIIQNADIEPETLRILSILSAEMPLKQATQLTAKISGEKKNRLYQYALKCQND
ncbi:16S rRNA (cytidine(1402)-2'-O)-methyltransferase [soil metagenome]